MHRDMPLFAEKNQAFPFLKLRAQIYIFRSMLKAKKKLIKTIVDDKVGVFCKIDQYSNIPRDEILDAAQRNSNVPKSFLSTTLDAIEKEIINHVMNGHSIEIPNFGTIYPSVKSVSLVRGEDYSDSEELASLLPGTISKVKFKFRPAPKIKRLINKQTIKLTTNVEPPTPIGISFNKGENYMPEPGTSINLDVGMQMNGQKFDTVPSCFQWPVSLRVGSQNYEEFETVKFTSSDTNVVSASISHLTGGRYALNLLGKAAGTAVVTLAIGYGKVWSRVQWPVIVVEA